MKYKILVILSLISALLLIESAYLSALPDLSLLGSDISLSEPAPETNQPVTINVTISNNGGDYGSQTYSSSISSFTTHIEEDCYAVYTSTWFAQYIVAPSTFYLGKVSLKIDNVGDLDDMASVQIRNHDTNSPFPHLKPAGVTANYIAQAEANYPSAAAGWCDFDFDIPVQLLEGSTYWICFNSQSDWGNRYRWWWGENTPDDGIAMSRNNGDTWFDVTQITVAGINNLTGLHKVYETVPTIIKVYIGNPSDGGNLIHTETIKQPVEASGQKSFSFPWLFGASGNYDIYVVIDEAGDIQESDISNNTAFNTITVIENPPEITSTEPADGSIGAPLNGALSVIFSKDMDPSTIQTAAFVLEATKNNLGVPISEITAGTASYEAGLRKAVFTPSQKLLPNYTYRLFVSSSVKDSFGNQIDQNKTITFTTAISKNYDAVLSDPGSLTYISISAGSIPEESFYLDIQTSPDETGAIKQALEKVPNGTVPFLAAAPGTVRSVKLYSGSFPGTLIENPRFAIPVSVTIPYTEENGIVSGTNPPVHESTLAIYWLNEENALWVKLPSSRVDTLNNTVTAETSHFSVFALLGETQSSLQNAYAYPVPFRPNSDPTHKHITFTGLSTQATIKIYTITGELVATIHESDGDGMCIWDARGAASGMYIYRIDNNREHKTGHLLIVK